MCTIEKGLKLTKHIKSNRMGTGFMKNLNVQASKGLISNHDQGKGKGGFQLENSTKFLFTIDPLCSQNVSADW